MFRTLAITISVVLAIAAASSVVFAAVLRLMFPSEILGLFGRVLLALVISLVGLVAGIRLLEQWRRAQLKTSRGIAERRRAEERLAEQASAQRKSAEQPTAQATKSTERAPRRIVEQFREESIASEQRKVCSTSRR